MALRFGFHVLGGMPAAEMSGIHLAAPAWIVPSKDIDPASLNPTTVTVARDPDGRWFVTLAVDVDQTTPAEPTAGPVGIDVGLYDFAVLSTGEKIR